jgi:hypothetical protein
MLTRLRKIFPIHHCRAGRVAHFAKEEITIPRYPQTLMLTHIALGSPNRLPTELVKKFAPESFR